MPQPDPLDDAFKRICTLDAPLNERLALYSAALREHAPSYAAAYDELVKRLQTNRIGWNAPGAGDELPAFSLPDADCRMHDLPKILSRGPAVVSFNRGHWCPYCLMELDALKCALAEINAAGGQVVSIMPETRAFTAQVAKEIDHAFPILSDENNGYALSIDLVMWVGDRVRRLFVADGLQLDDSQSNASWFVPIPATFVVGTDGIILARLVDPDFRRRMDIDEIVAALRLAR
jgi:peroxiredoxin